MPLVLRAIRSHPPPGIPVERAEKIAWRSCGGPLDEVGQLIRVLVEADLVSTGHALRLTREGRRIATQDHQHGGILLGRTLIRTGFFSDQARRITEVGIIDPASGVLRCSRQKALEAAPQLIGVLRRFSGVEWSPELSIPPALVEELTDVWALLPVRAPALNDPRKAIGDRGELYSYRLERIRANDRSRIRWVAREDDSLGYDIEDSSVTPERRIEAKASASQDVRFMLSANEWKVANRCGEDYEIHFWGGIDLTRAPVDEYENLRAAGYPWVYKNLPQQLAEGALTALPVQYLLEGRAHVPPLRGGAACGGGAGCAGS